MIKKYTKPIIKIEIVSINDILSISVSEGAYDDGFEWNGTIK